MYDCSVSCIYLLKLSLDVEALQGAPMCLKVLRMCDSIAVNSNHFRKLAPVAPTLKILDIKNNMGLQEETFQLIAENCNNLTELYCQSTKMSNRSLDLIAGSCKLLEVIDISYPLYLRSNDNQARDNKSITNCSKLFNCKRIRKLTASSTSITDESFEAIPNDIALEYIRLGSVPIRDGTLRCLGRVSTLKAIHIPDTKVTSTGLQCM
jgi:hypothetical protein